MIRVQELEMRYAGANVNAVAGVSFSAERGMLTAVVGPNGSGKSTLVRGLLGRMVPVRGTILIDGTPIDALSRQEVARRVAVVTQREEPVFPLSVTDYVSLGRLPFQSRWRSASADDQSKVQSALQIAGVLDFCDRDIDQLSGGEWQRVRIARALAQDCLTLVLDEPTTYLDVAHEMLVFQLARKLAQGGRAVLLVSHQMNLVARFADLMVLMSGGRVAAAGTPADVMRGDLLESVYGWPVVVSRDPATGTRTVVPLRRD